MLDYRKWAVMSDRDIAGASSSDSEDGRDVFDNRPTLFKHFERYRRTVSNEDANDDAADRGTTVNVIFDMPGEYYVNTYYNFTPSLKPTKAAHLNAFRQKMSTRISTNPKEDNLSQMRLTRKTQFTFIRPQLLLSRIRKRKMFGFMRDFAIDVIEREFMHKLDVCLQVNQCSSSGQGADDVVVPHGMFSWDYADFLRRRKLENVVWIELLVMETDQRCLEVEKLNIDMHELERMFKLIINGFRVCSKKRAKSASVVGIDPYKVEDLPENVAVEEDEEEEEEGDEQYDEDVIAKPDNFDLGSDVLKVIADAYDYINIYRNLTHELHLNSTAFREDINKSIAMTLGKRDSKDRAVLTNLEQAVMSQGIWSPIEMRYQLRHYKIMAKQAEYRMEKTTATYEEQIKQYTEAIRLENYSSQCAMNTYYQQIEKFKASINDFQTKYNNEYEAIDNRITYQTMTLDKLRETRRFYGEELVRFREAIQRVRDQDAEVEKQRQMSLARLEERRAQQALEAAARKKRKANEKKK